MIKYLQIENYKSLKRVGISLKNLNLFFGMNGMGKSSVIQSLLLLRQSFWNTKSIDKLAINGSLTHLGTAKDIFCSRAEERTLRFICEFDHEKVSEFDFLYDDQRHSEGFMDLVQGEKIPTEEALFSRDFYYLAAEHLGPQSSYRYDKWDEKGLNLLGNNGEYVVPFLAKYGDSLSVPKSLCLPEAKTDSLIDQTAAWLQRISPGLALRANMNFDQSAELYIKYEEGQLYSEEYLPINVGFGITYALPLIVIMLINKPGSIVLLENPESHLHPRGQSEMGNLLVKAAAGGTQIICESHSDHIINGIRVAVKNEIIENDLANICYFNKNRVNETYIESIRVDKNGMLSDYPVGLLDEWGDLMSQLI